MIVFSQHHNIIAEVVSLRIIKKMDKDSTSENKVVKEIAIVGTLADVGKDITIAKYKPSEEHIAIKKLELFFAGIKNNVFNFGGNV